MNELKNGDMVYVSDISEEAALDRKNKRIFIGKYDSAYVTSVTHTNEEFMSWTYAVKVSEPKVIPWTFKTCPLPPFCVQHKDSGVLTTLSAIHKDGVYLMENVKRSFNYLMDDYNYVISREDIRPCGEVK